MKRYLLLLILTITCNCILGQLTHEFIEIASIADSSWDDYTQITLGSDGTIFLANGDSGLFSYYFNGSSFTKKAHICEGESSIASDVAIGPDGTIFLANGKAGLWAYNYNGSSFINTASINDGGDSSWANDVAIGADGTIFLANGDDGLRVYNYNGSVFTNVAHIDSSNYSIKVAVGSDGTIFSYSSIWTQEMWVYTFQDSEIQNCIHTTEHWLTEIIPASNKRLFGCWRGFGGGGGIALFDYSDSSLIEVAKLEWNVSQIVSDIAVFDEETIFLTWMPGRLEAYSLNDTSFTQKAIVFNSESWDRNSVAVNSDGIVFFADGGKLVAYSLNPSVEINNSYCKIPKKYSIKQNHPNPFNPLTTISYDLPKSSDVSLSIYDITGRLVEILVHQHQNAGNYQVRWDASCYSSGVYFYRIQTGEFIQTRKMIVIK